MPNVTRRAFVKMASIALAVCSTAPNWLLGRTIKSEAAVPLRVPTPDSKISAIPVTIEPASLNVEGRSYLYFSKEVRNGHTYVHGWTEGFDDYDILGSYYFPEDADWAIANAQWMRVASEPLRGDGFERPILPLATSEDKLQAQERDR